MNVCVQETTACGCNQSGKRIHGNQKSLQSMVDRTQSVEENEKEKATTMEFRFDDGSAGCKTGKEEKGKKKNTKLFFK